MYRARTAVGQLPRTRRAIPDADAAYRRRPRLVTNATFVTRSGPVTALSSDGRGRSPSHGAGRMCPDVLDIPAPPAPGSAAASTPAPTPAGASSSLTTDGPPTRYIRWFADVGRGDVALV